VRCACVDTMIAAGSRAPEGRYAERGPVSAPMTREEAMTVTHPLRHAKEKEIMRDEEIMREREG